MDLPISFKFTSPVIAESYECPCISEFDVTTTKQGIAILCSARRYCICVMVYISNAWLIHQCRLCRVDLPITFSIASLIRRNLYDCPNTNEKLLAVNGSHESPKVYNIQNHNRAKITACIIFQVRHCYIMMEGRVVLYNRCVNKTYSVII